MSVHLARALTSFVVGHVRRLTGRAGGPGSPVERGLLLVDHGWQANMGDLAFPGGGAGLRELRQLTDSAGLRLALTINPFVSVESASFQHCVQHGLLVMERNSSSGRNIPALTWFKVQYFLYFSQTARFSQTIYSKPLI